MIIFTQDTLDFLQTIQAKNSRTWFAENKEWYNDALITPLKNFVEALSSTMAGIDSEFELRPMVNKTISRINRDTRFSKDKSLYKDRMWVTFKKPDKDKTDYPGFFFEITPYSFRYGMGFFSASTASMKAVRDSMDRHEKQFIKIAHQIEERGVFQIEGERYKRNQFPDKPVELQNWYNRKNIYLVYNSQMVDELFREEFIENIKADYLSLTELYEFLTEAMAKRR